MLFDRLKGVLPETSGEGTHFLVPWLQKAVIFDIRTRPRSISSVTGTKGAPDDGRPLATAHGSAAPRTQLHPSRAAAGAPLPQRAPAGRNATAVPKAIVDSLLHSASYAPAQTCSR